MAGKISTWQSLIFGAGLCTSLLALLTGCDWEQSDLRAESDPASAESKPETRPTNRLARETSPYLLLHAHNPVDWYPWGPEAMKKAKDEGKPIFLSIGYSSCHWCHVMERLVFSDPKIAAYMNEHFVNIKVDREERPDVDEVYMLALQVYYRAIGSEQTGGWPLSMFLTPDARPLGGGSYFPPEDTEERDGFPTLMKRVADAWENQRADMEKNAEFLSRSVQTAARPRLVFNPIKPSRELVADVTIALAETYDRQYGGFDYAGGAADRPKFPVPSRLALLQYEVRRHADEKAGEMLALTLDRMAAGGLHDQLGGGFHRYSTDRFWRVPHFEKMLYDNAQLADVYVEAYRQTHEARYRDVADGIFSFLLREMTDPAGGFYSALDADTEGEEGAYYIWTRAEIEKILTDEELELCVQLYGLDGEPNFEGKFVLEQVRTPTEVAEALRLNRGEFDQRWRAAQTKLLAARNARPALRKDDKVLSGWNGLAIRAFAHGGMVLNRPEYIRAAENAAQFVLANMRDEQGRLLRSYRAEQARIPAYVDDYAHLVEGLLALFEATDDEKWLNAAVRLTDRQLTLFWDERQKGLFFTAADQEQLLVRSKILQDSVLPSGNSVTVRNLIRLASYMKEARYRERAQQTLEAFTLLLQENPRGMTYFALAMGEFLDDPDFAAGRKTSQTERPFPMPRRGPVEPAGGFAEEPEDGAIEQAQFEKPPAPKKKKIPQHVSGKVYLSVNQLPPGGTCQFLVHLLIEEPWHINANPAVDEFAVATELTVTGKKNTEVTQLRYAPPTRLTVEGMDGPLLVYRNQTIIRGVLKVPAEAAGSEEELTFEVSYQACSEKTCLRPQTLNVTLPIRVARSADSVRAINDSLFRRPKSP